MEIFGLESWAIHPQKGILYRNPYYLDDNLLKTSNVHIIGSFAFEEIINHCFTMSLQSSDKKSSLGCQIDQELLLKAFFLPWAGKVFLKCQKERLEKLGKVCNIGPVEGPGLFEGWVLTRLGLGQVQMGPGFSASLWIISNFFGKSSRLCNDKTRNFS